MYVERAILRRLHGEPTFQFAAATGFTDLMDDISRRVTLILFLFLLFCASFAEGWEGEGRRWWAVGWGERSPRAPFGFWRLPRPNSLLSGPPPSHPHSHTHTHTRPPTHKHARARTHAHARTRRRFGPAHPFTAMVPDLSAGEDPDDAFSKARGGRVLVWGAEGTAALRRGRGGEGTRGFLPG